MVEKSSDNFSTSSESSTISGKKIKKEKKLLKVILKLKSNFADGYWIEAKNVTKKGPKTFIKQLNSCTSYRKREKNHTFTFVLYIPEAGYALINFLNPKMASQFIYERQGVIWQNQTDSESDSESESEESEESENCQKISQNGQKSENFQNFEEFEESDVDEEFDEKEENQEDEDEKKEKPEPNFLACVIRKIELDQEKLLGLLKKNLKKIKSRKKKYYLFLFKDTENAENYFKDVCFNFNNSIFY